MFLLHHISLDQVSRGSVSIRPVSCSSPMTRSCNLEAGVPYTLLEVGFLTASEFASRRRAMGNTFGHKSS